MKTEDSRVLFFPTDSLVFPTDSGDCGIVPWGWKLNTEVYDLLAESMED